jgi:hypothetical protein
MAKPPNKVLLAGVGALVVLAVLAVGAFTVGPFGGGGIEQPIAFRTTSMPARTRSPACTATRRRTARRRGHPAVQVCAGCHIPGGVPMIAATASACSSSIAYWREQRPIPWVKIYDLPDHARFPHMRHVNADVECQECHGPVETMEEIEIGAADTGALRS